MATGKGAAQEDCCTTTSRPLPMTSRGDTAPHVPSSARAIMGPKAAHPFPLWNRLWRSWHRLGVPSGPSTPVVSLGPSSPLRDIPRAPSRAADAWRGGAVVEGGRGLAFDQFLSDPNLCRVQTNSSGRATSCVTRPVPRTAHRRCVSVLSGNAMRCDSVGQRDVSQSEPQHLSGPRPAWAGLMPRPSLVGCQLLSLQLSFGWLPTCHRLGGWAYASGARAGHQSRTWDALHSRRWCRCWRRCPGAVAL